MITHKLTKHKIISLISIVKDIIAEKIEERIKLEHSLKRAEITAHLCVLRELDKKLRKKYISVEDRFQDYSFSISFDEMEGYLLVLYTDPQKFLSPEKGFDLLTIKQISEPTLKHLLA